MCPTKIVTNIIVHIPLVQALRGVLQTRIIVVMPVLRRPSAPGAQRSLRDRHGNIKCPFEKGEQWHVLSKEDVIVTYGSLTKANYYTKSQVIRALPFSSRAESARFRRWHDSVAFPNTFCSWMPKEVRHNNIDYMFVPYTALRGICHAQAVIEVEYI